MPVYAMVCECGETQEVSCSIKEREELEKKDEFFPVCKCGLKMKTSLKYNSFRMRIKHEI